MSSGAFTRSKYQSDQTTRIYNIRVQPETIAATLGGNANAAPSGDVTEPTSARARGSRRSLGIVARRVTLEFTADPPDGYEDDLLTIPVLTPTVFNALNIGATGTYLGAAVRVVGLTPESRR